MANDYLSIFGPAADPRVAQIAAAREQELALARLTPAQQIAASRTMGAGNAGRGTAQLVAGGIGAATGVDVREPQDKLAAAKARVQAALRGKDMTDPAVVYPVLIQALQQEGLVREAVGAAKEYETLRNEREDRSLARTREARLQAGQDARLAIEQAKLDDPKSPVGKIMADVDAMRARLAKLEPGSPAAQALERQIDIALRKAETSIGAGVKLNKLGDRTEVTAPDGTVLRVVYHGVDPNTAARVADSQAGRAQVNEKMTDELARSAASASELRLLVGGFKPQFAMPSVMDRVAAAVGQSDLKQKLDALAASTPAAREAADWWQRLAERLMRVRHEIFGATLTAGETQAFDSVRPLRGLPPAVVLQRLQAMTEAAEREHQRRVAAQAAQGRNVEGLGGPAPAAPSAPAAPAAPSAAPAGVTVKRIS